MQNAQAQELDARTLQFLKDEVNRHDSGALTLTKVFRGLLSVHNRHLEIFADALKSEECNGQCR